MNANIPEKYLNRIPEGLIIEWHGRRKFYEVIEEITDALWYIFLILWVYRLLIYSGLVAYHWQSFLAVFLCCIVAILPAWLEIEKWYGEYHIVARHSDRDGGVVYKFDGIINPNTVPINISPVMDLTKSEYKNNAIYWVWKTLTGNRMEKVNLKTAPNAYALQDRRIDPGYSLAIERIQHSPAPHRMAKDIPFWANVDGLIRLKNQGNIVDLDEISETATTLVRSLRGDHNGRAELH
jgi:hypothetical protein